MSQNQISVNVNDMLKTHIKDYVPASFGYNWFLFRNRPVFTQFTVREMILDPRVNFGLWLIKGPMLAKGRFEVESSDPTVQQFAIDQINNFMLNGAVQALKAVEWGYSGSEVLYERNEETGTIDYCGLKDFDSPSVKVVTKNGVRTGILVTNFYTLSMQPSRAVYLGGPKCLHHVHWRHVHPHYGMSRLISAHIPYNEKWSEGGFRDIRRMWFYKNAFEGGTMYHPQGYYKTPEGRVVAYQDLAQSLIEKKRAGATLTLPSSVDARSGQRNWEYVPAKGNTIPAGLFEYGNDLDIEILEAMGIPYEVIEASGNEGFGSSSGRQIPETAFYSILQEELNWLIFDFVNQNLRPLIQINAALGLLPYATIKVLAYPLESSQMLEQNGPQMPEDKNNKKGQSSEEDEFDDEDDETADGQNEPDDDDSDENRKKILAKNKPKPNISLVA